MKVYGTPRGPQARGKKLRGAFITYTRKDGREIIQSWPRKRGHYQSKRQREWGEWFAAASRWATAPDPGSQLDALEVTDGTIFMPRDYLLKLARGKLWQVQLEDGTILWNVWEMAEQIQVELDTISETPGSVLYRAPEGWVALLPGDDADVLTLNGGLPKWLPATGGGGTSGILYNVSAGTSTSTYNVKGMKFSPMLDAELSALYAGIDATHGETYYAMLARLDGDTIAEVVWQSDPLVVSGSGNVFYEFAVNGSVGLTGWDTYCMCVVCTSRQVNENPYVLAGGGTLYGFPVTGSTAYMRMRNAEPTVGDTFESGGGAYYLVGAALKST